MPLHFSAFQTWVVFPRVLTLLFSVSLLCCLLFLSLKVSLIANSYLFLCVFEDCPDPNCVWSTEDSVKHQTSVHPPYLLSDLDVTKCLLCCLCFRVPLDPRKVPVSQDTETIGIPCSVVIREGEGRMGSAASPCASLGLFLTLPSDRGWNPGNSAPEGAGALALPGSHNICADTWWL